MIWSYGGSKVVLGGGFRILKVMLYIHNISIPTRCLIFTSSSYFMMNDLSVFCT